jgi:membrane associated rhomboid family serine protease
VPEVCYRHPNRETGVSCSNCGRPICPDCMTSTSVGMRCPECAGEKTRVQTGVSSGVGGSGSEPWATYVLIALNVAAFFAELASGAGTTTVGTGDTLISDGGLFGPAIDQNGEWYRIVTAGFLHAGIFHIGLNMFVLFILGRLLEPAIGIPRFLALYFVSLLAGSFGALLLEPVAVTVGASGAVYGLMGATIVIARRRGAEQIVSQIGIWLALNIVISFTISGISIGGHLGGLVGGTLAALVIAGVEQRAGGRNAIALEMLGMAAIGIGAVVGSLWAAGQTNGIL